MKTMAFFNYMETIGRILLQSPPVTKSTATHMLILSGQVLTEDRLFLLRKRTQFHSFGSTRQTPISQTCASISDSLQEICQRT